MNYICSIFLTFYIVVRPLIPIMEYAVNYDYIAEVLCVNKNKPELNCNGKCYLSKELAKTNDTETAPLSKGKTSGQKILDIYILPEITEIKNTGLTYDHNFTFIYQKNYSFLFLKHIFRPPVF
ncbi:hypothetical protein ACNFU2_15875 [Chryseobacterium sp. PTM-20240506]|uniref:hypothetical protein n=1 Tax=unclassified Chryseobacterium TaxID=2593645 RepID=UPI0015580518|nr:MULTISPECIES: hypothetical protein [unclassified Chryseobacterium]MDQ1804875.1 hypothetical protein [Chryseobacterium sp. CKR4-1]